MNEKKHYTTTGTLVVVIPAYNEAPRIKPLLVAIKKLHINCLVVDDGSTDQTAKIASRFTPHVIKLNKNLGKSQAIKIGCQHAIKNLHASKLILFDADGQHQVSCLHSFNQILDSNSDAIITGSRYGNSSEPSSKILGKICIIVEFFLLNGRFFRDPLCGLKAFTKQSFQKLDLNSSGYNLEAEILVKICKKNINLIEMPIISLPESMPKNGCSPFDGLKIMAYILKSRFSRE